MTNALQAKITADCSDPYEGRYSGRILVPTSRPLQLGIFLTPDPHAPFAAGDKLLVSFAARSSPPGANVSIATGAMGVGVPTGTVGGEALGADWALQGPYEVTLQNVTTGEPGTLGAFQENALVHMIVATPYKTATIVHVDVVSVTKRSKQ